MKSVIPVCEIKRREKNMKNNKQKTRKPIHKIVAAENTQICVHAPALRAVLRFIAYIMLQSPVVTDRLLAMFSV